jgi:diguanylate cyclase (GGDEF)-like protein/PAS domain S-box-containing protein
VDRDYKLVKFNEVYARTRDKRPSDIYGHKCYEIFHNRTCICDGCVVDKTFKSGDPCAQEKLLTSGDGSQIWVEIYTYPIFDENRTVSHVVEYSRDITDRKKADGEKRQLINTLNNLSNTDSLTGLLNRRALNDMLAHEIDRATRYNADLALILCDVDRFKNINDTFGHRAGDRALQAVAETLKSSIRRADIVGRYGGDEFMIIMPETSLAGAHSLAEKIRVAVNKPDFALSGNKRIRLSVSLGVAGCCSSPENIDTLVALADAQLYASKQAGRNRVTSAQMDRNHTPSIA